VWGYKIVILRPYVASPVLSQQVVTKTGPFTALRGTPERELLYSGVVGSCTPL